MPAPALDSFAAELYEQLAPLAYADADHGYPLAQFCATIGSLFQEIDDLARDDGAIPGWGKLVDVELAPEDALPYLGQFIGVTVNEALLVPARRDQIRKPQGFDRGTRTAIIDAAQATLTGAKTVTLVERVGGDAYAITVITRTAETPNPAATLAALQAAKPAGLKLTHTVVAGQTFAQLKAGYATFAAVTAHYPTLAGVRDAIP